VVHQIPRFMCLLILDMADHGLPLFGSMLKAKLLPNELQAPQEPIHSLKAREWGLQIPERVVLVARGTPGRSPLTGRFDPKAKLLSKEHMGSFSLQHIELDLDRVATNFI
jgi:hypothetical protein